MSLGKREMEELKTETKCKWKTEYTKWFQTHMIIFYAVTIVNVTYFMGCNDILRLQTLTAFENLIVVSFMFILIVINAGMWNTCMIRQEIEEIKRKQ